MVDTAEVLQLCQFCLCEDSPSSLIVSPCLCSIRVHALCLENWLNYKKHKNCDDCNFVFNVETRLKYTFVESIRIWLEHPLNRTYFLTHIVLVVFLNTVAALLMGMTSQHIVRLLQNNLDHFSYEYWRLGSFALTLMPATLLFLRCNVIFVETHIIPWYRWWRSRIRYQLKIIN